MYILVPKDFIETDQISITTTSQTPTTKQLIQTCIGQDNSKQPIIIDTDTDVDDLWAILYLLNVKDIQIILFLFYSFDSMIIDSNH